MSLYQKPICFFIYFFNFRTTILGVKHIMDQLRSAIMIFILSGFPSRAATVAGARQVGILSQGRPGGSWWILVDWEGFRGQNLPQPRAVSVGKMASCVWIFGMILLIDSLLLKKRVTRLHVVHIVHFTYEPAQQFRETCQTAPGCCILFPRKAMKDHGTQARFPGSIDLNLVVHMALGHMKLAGKLLFSPAKLWQNHRF